MRLLLSTALSPVTSRSSALFKMARVPPVEMLTLLIVCSIALHNIGRNQKNHVDAQHTITRKQTPNVVMN